MSEKSVVSANIVSVIFCAPACLIPASCRFICALSRFREHFGILLVCTLFSAVVMVARYGKMYDGGEWVESQKKVAGL